MSIIPHRLGYAPPASEIGTVRFHDGLCERSVESVAEETPVTLAYNGVTHAVMMASPSDLEDFATGFSLTEGLIPSAADLQSIGVVRHAMGIELQMEVPAAIAALAARSRRMAGRTGCGLCGQESVEQVLRELPPVTSSAVFAAGSIARAMAALAARQPLNALTGAVHAAGWASPDGVVHAVREDVGRHNALDKLIGALARAGVDASTGFVVVTSRASFEMVQKAVALGAPLLAAVSAPTMLAVQVAERAGVALAGFARENRVTLYAHASRVRMDDGQLRPSPAPAIPSS